VVGDGRAHVRRYYFCPDWYAGRRRAVMPMGEQQPGVRIVIISGDNEDSPRTRALRVRRSVEAASRRVIIDRDPGDKQ
jgi:hypothetical protein